MLFLAPDADKAHPISAATTTALLGANSPKVAKINANQTPSTSSSAVEDDEKQRFFRDC